MSSSSSAAAPGGAPAPSYLRNNQTNYQIDPSSNRYSLTESQITICLDAFNENSAQLANQSQKLEAEIKIISQQQTSATIPLNQKRAELDRASANLKQLDAQITAKRIELQPKQAELNNAKEAQSSAYQALLSNAGADTQATIQKTIAAFVKASTMVKPLLTAVERLEDEKKSLEGRITELKTTAEQMNKQLAQTIVALNGNAQGLQKQISDINQKMRILRAGSFILNNVTVFSPSPIASSSSSAGAASITLNIFIPQFTQILPLEHESKIRADINRYRLLSSEDAKLCHAVIQPQMDAATQSLSKESAHLNELEKELSSKLADKEKNQDALASSQLFLTTLQTELKAVEATIVTKQGLCKQIQAEFNKTSSDFANKDGCNGLADKVRDLASTLFNGRNELEQATKSKQALSSQFLIHQAHIKECESTDKRLQRETDGLRYRKGNLELQLGSMKELQANYMAIGNMFMNLPLIIESTVEAQRAMQKERESQVKSNGNFKPDRPKRKTGSPELNGCAGGGGGAIESVRANSPINIERASNLKKSDFSQILSHYNELPQINKNDFLHSNSSLIKMIGNTRSTVAKFEQDIEQMRKQGTFKIADHKLHGLDLIELIILQGRDDLLQSLLKYEDIDLAQSKQALPLLAAQNMFNNSKVASIIEKMTKKGAPITLPFAKPPIHIAAYHNHKYIFAALLKQGADLKQYDNEGFAVIHLLAIEGHVDLLKAHKASFNSHLTLVTHDNIGDALSLAANIGHAKVVEFFINQKHSLATADFEEWTALDHVRKASIKHNRALAKRAPERTVIEKLLTDHGALSISDSPSTKKHKS